MNAAHEVTAAEPLLVRVEVAAARLGIARTSMFHLVATRQIESVLIGRSRRIPVACLDEYVAQLRHDAAVLAGENRATRPDSDA